MKITTLEIIKDINNFYREGSQFRIVDWPAIEDAIKYGVIRSKTGLYHGIPEYLVKTFPEYIGQIKDWQKMKPDRIIRELKKLGAFKGMSVEEAATLKTPVRESTNYGNMVSYYQHRTYPNYYVSHMNYVIETPTSAGYFIPGIHGRTFDWPLNDSRTGATVLADKRGNTKGVFISTKGSSYWSYCPELDAWKNTPFITNEDIKL